MLVHGIEAVVLGALAGLGVKEIGLPHPLVPVGTKVQLVRFQFEQVRLLVPPFLGFDSLDQETLQEVLNRERALALDFGLDEVLDEVDVVFGLVSRHVIELVESGLEFAHKLFVILSRWFALIHLSLLLLLNIRVNLDLLDPHGSCRDPKSAMRTVRTCRRSVSRYFNGVRAPSQLQGPSRQAALVRRCLEHLRQLLLFECIPARVVASWLRVPVDLGSRRVGSLRS